MKTIQGSAKKGMSAFRKALMGGLVVALIASATMFAFTYTSASTSITATSGGSDFAAVTANNTVASYAVLGSHKGTIGSGNLFNVTPAAAYTGDLEVSVYLVNMDQLTKTYGMFLLKVEMVAANNTPVDIEGIEKPLTLENGVVTFLASTLTPGTTYYIKTTGGAYRAFPWAFIGGNIYGPTLYANIAQAG